MGDAEKKVKASIPQEFNFKIAASFHEEWTERDIKYLEERHWDDSDTYNAALGMDSHPLSF